MFINTETESQIMLGTKRASCVRYGFAQDWLGFHRGALETKKHPRSCAGFSSVVSMFFAIELQSSKLYISPHA